jgi:hypothetical protein
MKVLHSTLYMYLIPQSFVCLLICVIVLYCKLSKDIIHYYEISCYLIEEGMVSDIIHNLSIDFVTCFVVLFSVLIMVHGEFSGVLIMDNSKLETKDNHREWAVIRCIFCVIYEKRE